jgi:hypothetical protein
MLEGAIMKFRHYKGGIYELVCEATLESDLSTMVVYRAANGSIWCRPKDVFFELIEIDGAKVQRFTLIEPDPVS